MTMLQAIFAFIPNMSLNSMKKLQTLLSCICFFGFTHQLLSQEIKSTVQVVSPGIQITNKTLLTTLQNAMQQFVNNRKWTDEKFENREKIELAIFLEVKKFEGEGDISATMQITATRPVFNSTYKTNTFLFNDEDISFTYKEFQALDYQENQNLNDLTSLLAYYTYLCLGFDFDSYGEMGGTPFFNKAQQIVSLCQGRPGWGQTDGKGIRNRYNLIENITNTRFNPIRKLMYSYHRKGMDQFYEKPEEARKNITEGLQSLQELVAVTPNSTIHRVFFSSKTTELVEIYKGATVPEKNEIVQLLSLLDPVNRQKWEKIKS